MIWSFKDLMVANEDDLTMERPGGITFQGMKLTMLVFKDIDKVDR